MMPASLKHRMQSGEQLNGCFINLFSPLATEIIAHSGFDCILIDMEHGPGSFTDAIAMMQAAAGSNCASIIRTESSDTAVIKRTMDIGPQGIMIPNVKSASEAERIVKDCRYPPAGSRGAAPPVIRGSTFGLRLDDYFRFLENDFLLILQIETGLDNAEVKAIASVQGVDMIFIGPTDLSGSIGTLSDFGSDKFAHAVDEIERGTRQASKLLGSIPFGEWTTKKLYESGYSLVLCGFDVVMVRESALSNVEQARLAANRSP
ncbi:MAG: aldolase/citrate lyase family protein [Pseudomonadota bacterium]